MDRKLVYAVAVALVLAACSSDDLLRPEETEIRLSTGLDVKAETRGITDNSYTGTLFSGGESVDVNIKETNNGTSAIYGTDGWLTATIGDGGTGATLSPVCYWPSSGAGIDIYGWYPASTAETYWTTARSVFKVPATQNGNTNHKLFDLMYATPESGTGDAHQTVAASTRASAINLQFHHKLAKLVVVLTPKDGNAGVTENDLKNATVTIGDVKTTADVVPATGAVTASNTAEREILSVMANEAGTTGYALIPAQTLSGTLTVKLKAGGQMETTLYSFEVQEGKTNTLNVKVSLTGITVTTTIVQWTENNSAGNAELKL